MYRVNKLSFFLLSVVYIVGTYYLIWLLEFVKQILSSYKIHLDFGHADSSLVEIILVFYLLAFINLIVVCVRRFIR